jgi:hypothetical protein
MADNVIQIEVEIEGKKGFVNLKKESSIEGEKAGQAFGDSFADSLKKSLLSVKTAIAALAAAGLSSFAKQAIDQAIEQESANRRLEDSLRRVGALTRENRDFLIEQAEILAKTTKVTDDQAASLLALANNYAKSAPEAAKLTKAALDLSAATGIDTTAALEMLGNSLNGIGRGLNTSIPGFQKVSEEALRAGAAIEFVQNKFGGSAEASYNGTAAALSKVSKSFDELLESIGKFLIDTLQIDKVLSGIASGLNSAQVFVSSLNITLDDLINKFISLSVSIGLVYAALNAKAIFSTIVTQLTLISDTLILNGLYAGQFGVAIKAAFFSGELAAKAFTVAVKASQVALTLGLVFAIDAVISKFLEFKQQGLGVFDAIKATVLTVVGVIIDAFGALIVGIQNGLSKIPVVGQTLANSFNMMTEGLALAKNQVEQTLFAMNALTPAVQAADQALASSASNGLALYSAKMGEIKTGITEVISNAQSFGSYISTEFVTQVNAAGKEIADGAYRLSINVKAFLVDTLVQGAQSVVKAMMTGKNAFQAFSNAVLGIVGNMLVQIGTALISIGIGIDALKVALGTLSGGLAIAAGLALVAIGTLLQGLSGGSALEGSVSGGTGSAGGAFGGAAPGTDLAQVEKEKPKTEVVVNVEGNIFNGKEQAELIASNLQEYFDTNAGILARS